MSPESGRRFVFGAVLLATAAVLSFAAKSLDAGVSGSPHDFSAGGPYTKSATIAPSGPCSSCHIPHGADAYALWSRNLSSYRSLLEVNGGGTYQINYVHAPTIPCYDCHDTHTSGNIDDNPAGSLFSSNHKPQDTAFGGDGPRGVAGYYENNPPDNTYQKGANPNLNPNDSAQLSKTGGHYFKIVDPDGAASAYRKGDKLPCRDCHDPHAYSDTWRVFIRYDLPNAGDVTSLSPLYGSESMTNLSTGSHDNASSRKICVSCHAYSNTTTQPVRHDQVSSAYTDTSRIPKPPPTVNEHTNSSSVQNVPCVLCHSHNAIDPNCAGCHGFSPNPYAPSRGSVPPGGPYPSGRDPHPQHVGREDGQPLNSFSVYNFTCTVCHATSALGSRPSGIIHKNNVIDIAYDFSALGVQNPPDTTSPGHLTCSNVYCHSNGGSDNTMANYYRTVRWGDPPAPLACNGCHGYGVDNTLGTPQYGMPNYTSGTAGSKTANTHLAHVVNGGYECSVCHFNTATGTYRTARTIKAISSANAYHVNGSRDVVFDNTNATGSYNVDNNVANNKRCDVSCHGTGKPMAQRPQWGGTLPFGCFDCHSGTEQKYKPQIDYGVAKTPNPVDNAEYLYSGHGRSSAQGNYPGSGNPTAGFSNYTTAPVACYVCHSGTAPHTTKSANDPFRLGSATDNTLGGFGGTGGVTGSWADNTDALCLGCHGDSTQRATHDNAAKGTTTIDALTHARGITGTKYNWPTSPWKCVDCHDPHGDGKSGAERFMMLRSGINAPVDNTDTQAGSDGKSIPKRADNTVVRSVAFNSLAGFAAGSYAQPGNGSGGTWGPCEVCHTQTNAYSRTLDNAATHSGRTSRCTTCHPHSLGFAPTCFGCHGSSGNKQYWPAGSPGTYPNRAGAHGNHVDTIGTWLYQENAALLLQNTAKGSTSTKQVAICGWCHPNPGSARPGTGELDHTDNTWTPGIADVHRDGRTGAAASYIQYFDGNLSVPGGVNDTLAAFDNTHSCTNTLCHSKAATPATWNAPPTWGTDNCASTQCHPSPTTTSLSGAHYTHVAPKVMGSVNGGMGYPCSECHVIPTSLRHGNGQVNLGFGGLEASVGGGNGFYDKDNSGGSVPSAGDNNFRAYDNVYSRSCANIYCHGGDNAEWGGTGTRPVWDNSAYVAMYHCGPCHAFSGSPYDSAGVAKVPFSTGSHGVHFKQYTSAAGVESVNRGPRIEPPMHSYGCAACHNMGSVCANCHATHGETGAAQPTSTHADGKVDFKPTAGTPAGSVPPPAGVTLAATHACDNCHSTATVVTRTYPSPGTTGDNAAKANWDNGAFRLDCLTCHNGVMPGNSKAGGEGIAAPNVYGDGAAYGAEARGHNRPTSSGNFPGTGNPAANRTCGECHNAASMHINGVVDNAYSGERLLDNVNGVTGITTVSGLCSACHTTAGTSPATKKSVNTHGNTGFAKRLEGSTFALECAQCHEPHGMVNVSTGTTGVNLWMINPTITVATGNTVSPVRLFAKSGANSFNSYDPGAGNELNASLFVANASDQICAVCHANSAAAGFPMTWNIGARHNAPGYAGNEAGKNCAGCHSHNQDGVIGTLDGLMPLACNDCHSYPGLDNTGVMKLMSVGHRKHVGQSFPGGDNTNNKGYECTLCHFNYDHNPSGLAKGQAWPATYYDNVNIRFDNAWNPGAPTYAGANAGTATAPGVGGTGACAGLYCHGGNASLNARWRGSATTPTWSGTVACGACHDTGTSDTTPGTVIPTGNHPVHIDNNYLYGPGLASFSSGGGCAEGTGCHPRYDLTPIALGGLHANNLKELRSTPSDNGSIGTTLSATQVCRNCHTTYTSVNIPVSGDNQVRIQANWNDNTFWLDCLTCHNGSAPGTQAKARIDGSGGVAGAIEGTYYTMGHGQQPVECGWCHSDVGHIGSRRLTGSNPWRLDMMGYFPTLGGMDYYCNVCHAIYGIPLNADHTWRVSGTGSTGPETKGSTDTHPTTVLAVGTDKDRWYQVPPSTHVPLFGNMQDNNYNKAGGTNNYVLCVSCHDPHGVGTAPLDPGVRRFSGQNTDPKGGKTLRFNYSTGSPTELCSQCHK